MPWARICSSPYPTLPRYLPPPARNTTSPRPRICLSAGPASPSPVKTSRPGRIAPGEGSIVPSAPGGIPRAPVLPKIEHTEEGSLKLGNDEGEGVVFDLHTLVEGSNLGHHLEIVFEEIGLKHGVKILGNLLSLVEAALQVIRYLSNVRDMHVLVALVIVFGELEINFLREEEFQEKVH